MHGSIGSCPSNSLLAEFGSIMRRSVGLSASRLAFSAHSEHAHLSPHSRKVHGRYRWGFVVKVRYRCQPASTLSLTQRPADCLPADAAYNHCLQQERTNHLTACLPFAFCSSPEGLVPVLLAWNPHLLQHSEACSFFAVGSAVASGWR